ncbi:MAG: ATP-binding protein [Gammaproteobacteria bacterium]|jgi:anti-sigma regulatory factor (Ser/Thr protein kinase)|nr:ATP-binding protein [Gammaproteobacteria bacterium]
MSKHGSYPSQYQESSQAPCIALYLPRFIQIYHFSFQDIEEASQIAEFITSHCPLHYQKRVQIGINEIFINAIEHGNLGISCELKSYLKKRNQWEQEIHNRLGKEENRSKFVNVKFELNPNSLSITVKDQGCGFDWKNFCKPNKINSHKQHGRGILMAKEYCFDSMEFSQKGHEVRCMIAIN